MCGEMVAHSSVENVQAAAVLGEDVAKYLEYLVIPRMVRDFPADS
jgi:hypothetical protein